jgi:hypothetical protein
MTLIRLPVVACTDKLLSSILEHIDPERCICSTTHCLAELEDGHEDGVFGVGPFFAFCRCKFGLDGCQLRCFCTGVVVIASLTGHVDYKERLKANESTWSAKGIYSTWRRRVKPESALAVWSAKRLAVREFRLWLTGNLCRIQNSRRI